MDLETFIQVLISPIMWLMIFVCVSLSIGLVIVTNLLIFLHNFHTKVYTLEVTPHEGL